MRTIVSFVVDALPEHYFKAELLLFSLHHLAGMKKEDVVVHCVDRVPDHFRAFLDRNGYRHRSFPPHIDGKYCNKLPQLASLDQEDCAGVFLLDIDMIVLEPLQVEDPSRFTAKVVDGPNPPLEVLQGIYRASGLAMPKTIDTDWVMPGGETLETNWNGGFYYVPKALIADLAERWDRWAQWLFERPELFETDAQRNHVDQISMGMAVHESGITWQALTANSNLPLHNGLPLRSFREDQPIQVLHYHWMLHSGGTLDDSKSTHPSVLEAIARANDAIAGQRRFDYYPAARKPREVGAPVQPSDGFLEGVRNLAERFPETRLILHAGTPKTGTTSLQHYLSEHRETHRSAGTYYPAHMHDYPDAMRAWSAPKHQWLINNLLRAEETVLLQNLKECFASLEDGGGAQQMFLSTEGLYNHWWDLTPRSRGLLQALAETFPLSVWVWFREPVKFADSFYRQNIKNPQIPAAACYGHDLSFRDALDDPWFTQRLDYLGFLEDCEALLGEGCTKAFFHNGDTLGTACRALGLEAPEPTKEKRHNTGLSNGAIEVLRVINRYPLTPGEKTDALEKVNELNGILREHSQEPTVTAEGAQRVWWLTALSAEVLKAPW